MMYIFAVYFFETFQTPTTSSTQNLHIRKFCCTFAPQSREIDSADILEKRLLALVLVIRKLEIFANPRQEGSKRP